MSAELDPTAPANVAADDVKAEPTSEGVAGSDVVGIAEAGSPTAGPEPKSPTFSPDEDVIPAAPDLDADKFGKLDFLLERTKTFIRFIDDTSAAAALDAADDSGENSPKRRRTDDAAAAPRPAGDAAACAAAADAASAKTVGASEQSGQPSLVTAPLRDYQIAAVKWLESLYLNGFNGILADEMGLGKTVTTVSFFCRLWENKICGPFLVVAPLSCLANWVNEVNKWAGGAIPCLLYHGSKEHRTAMQAEGRLARLARGDRSRKAGCCVVTSFDIAMNDQKFLRRIQWRYVVVDEAHRLKNMNCKLIQEMKKLNTEYRLLLTGTPLQNNIAELWSLLNFILPAIFDDLAAFQKWFDFDHIVDGEDDDDDDDAAAAEGEGGDGAAAPAAKKTAGWRAFATKPGATTPAAAPSAAAAAAADRRRRKTVLHSEQQTRILGKLHEIIRPFVLRRLKSEVGLAIPRKREIALYCEATARQREAMDALMSGTFEAYMKREQDAAGRHDASRGVRFSNVVMQLRKVCNHPFLFAGLNPFAAHVRRVTADAAVDPGSDEDGLRAAVSSKTTVRLPTVTEELIDPMSWESPEQRREYGAALAAGSGKFEILAKMLPSLHSQGHRCLIFSQMVQMLDLIEDWLVVEGYAFRRLDGSIPQAERQARIEAYNGNPEIFAFLLSTRAGGLGLNLTGADTVIIYDSDWNPQADLQAQDRAHRIGQTRPVAVYRLLTANSVESYLMHRATQKLRLEHLVIEKGNFNRNRRGALFSTKQDLEDVMTLQGGDGAVHFGDTAIDDATLADVLDRAKLIGLVKETAQQTDTAAAEAADVDAAAVAAAILAKGGDDAEALALAALDERDAAVRRPNTRRAGFEILEDLSAPF